MKLEHKFGTQGLEHVTLQGAAGHALWQPPAAGELVLPQAQPCLPAAVRAAPAAAPAASAQLPAAHLLLLLLALEVRRD